ncbi:MAG: F0F1 ATP synthase subunit delta, partial [Verrucomicrobiota bacterium]
MKSGKEFQRAAKKLFQASVVNGVLDPKVVQSVVRKLSDAKPRGYLQVITAYWRLVRLEVKKNSAVVESAVELDATTRSEVEAGLKKKYGDDDNFDIIVNPDKGDLEIWRNRIIVANGEVEDENLEIEL